MKLWTLRYHSAKGHQGALLKCEWRAGVFGLSDLHPWPEFGEPDLEELIVDLASGKIDTLVELALEANALDARLRETNRNAFLGLDLPRSHKLVMSSNALSPGNLNVWKDLGFKVLKVKLVREDAAKASELDKLICSSDFVWRFDFGGSLSAGEAKKWWIALSDAAKGKIDFVEDPTRGEPAGVGKWADDWYQQPTSNVKIFKPGHDLLGDTKKYRRVVFTHAFEHEFGQSYALWVAAKFYRELHISPEVCGFDSGSPRLKPQEGLGFGFDELLLSDKWERCL